MPSNVATPRYLGAHNCGLHHVPSPFTCWIASSTSTAADDAFGPRPPLGTLDSARPSFSEPAWLWRTSPAPCDEPRRLVAICCRAGWPKRGKTHARCGFWSWWRLGNRWCYFTTIRWAPCGVDCAASLTLAFCGGGLRVMELAPPPPQSGTRATDLVSSSPSSLGSAASPFRDRDSMGGESDTSGRRLYDSPSSSIVTNATPRTVARATNTRRFIEGILLLLAVNVIWVGASVLVQVLLGACVHSYHVSLNSPIDSTSTTTSASASHSSSPTSATRCLSCIWALCQHIDTSRGASPETGLAFTSGPHTPAMVTARTAAWLHRARRNPSR